MTHYRLDPSTRLVPGSDLLIGGSPLRLFRLAEAGRRRFEQIAGGGEAEQRGLVERLVESGAIHPVPVGASQRLADTTVVIPTHAPDIGRLYTLVQACQGAHAVIVVDDGSPVPIGDVDGATVIRNNASSGPAAARNTGVAHATTEYVAFVDDDVTVADPEWLSLLLGHFDDSAVVAVAPRVRAPDGRDPLAAFEREHSPLDLGPLSSVVGPGRRVSYVPAAALVIRRGVFEEIGGFDPALRFGEDVDLVWRLVDRGSRCRYEAHVEVSHRARGSWRAWARQRFDYGTSAAPLASRHSGALAPVRTTGWSLAIWALVFVKRPLAALGLGAFTTVALYRKVGGLGGRESVRLTATGHLFAGRLFAGAARRAWLPVLAAGAVRSRWCRRVLAAALAASIADRGSSPRSLLVGLADDACYCAGLWKGVLTEREPGPLLPDISSWPGSSSDR